MTDKPICPNCGWSSRVEYLRRTKSFKCTHCGKEWEPEKEGAYGGKK